jgi:hypothetical protein
VRFFVYSFLIFIINYVFFIFISVYVPKSNIESEIFIFALVFYGVIIVKLESKIDIKRNIKYLVFSCSSLAIFILTSFYLKYYLYNIPIFEIYFIFVFLVFFVVPLVQYYGLPKILKGKE